MLFPIALGYHCRDVVMIFEQRNESTEDEVDPDAIEKEIAELDTELDSLCRRQKYLLARREMDSATGARCQATADIESDAVNRLLRTAPRMAFVSFLGDRMNALEQLPVPQITKPKGGDAASLADIVQSQEGVNDVVRFSIQEGVRTHLYDPSDGGHALDFQADALKHLEGQLEDAARFHADVCERSVLVNLLAHVHAIKNLATKVTEFKNASENVTPSEAENILRQCIEIVRSRHDKLKTVNVRANADNHDSYDLAELRDERAIEMQNLAARIHDHETLEGNMYALRDRVYTSQILRLFHSCLDILGSHKAFVQSTNTPSAVAFRGLRPAGHHSESFLMSADELKQLTIRAQDAEVELEPKDNRQALAYLATLERSVDTSRLAALPPSPKSVAESLVDELVNRNVFRFSKGREYIS